MADYHEANDNANRAIIQELVEQCEDPEIASVIRCYNIGAKGAEIRKDMNKLRVPLLKKSAIHLGLYPEGDTRKLKADIITDIMTRLNSLLMDLCGVCSDYFKIDLQEKPLYTCLICQQGCHTKCFEPIKTLFNALDENQKKAFQFICTSCSSDYADAESTEITVNAPKVKKSPIKETSSDTDEEIEAEGNDETINSDPPGSPKTNEGIVTGNSEGDGENTVKICPAYKWGRCPDYENCQYRHPPRCWKWLTHGKCSLKNKCRFHHPPLCYNSIWERQCLNLECKYFHLYKTQRKMEDEQLKNALTPANYQSQLQQHAQVAPIPPHQAMQVPYQAQFPQLPQPQNPAPQSHYNQAPQQQCYPAIRPQQQPTIVRSGPDQPVNIHPQFQQQQQPTNNSNQPAQSNFSQSDLSFLAKTIKEVIKEDLTKELISIKQDLDLRIRQLTIPHQQIAPFMISQVPGMK